LFNMTKRERETFLAEARVGVLSIEQFGKGPLTVPLWYDYEPGGTIWLITDRESVKGKLLQDAGRISLCVQTEIPPYQYVSVEGPFTMTDLQPGQVESMAKRYYGDERGKAYAEVAEPALVSGMIVSLEPQTWYTADYSKSPYQFGATTNPV